MEAHINNRMKLLENQIAQLSASNSQRQPVTLPNQHDHPTNTESANSITTRSGVSYEGPSTPSKKKETGERKSDTEKVEERPCEVEERTKEVQAENKEVEAPILPPFVPKLSFPKSNAKTHLEKQYAKFMKIVQHI